MIKDDYDKIFALKPIAKDERMQQIRVLKPETREKLRKMKKKGLIPRQSTTKRRQSTT